MAHVRRSSRKIHLAVTVTRAPRSMLNLIVESFNAFEMPIWVLLRTHTHRATSNIYFPIIPFLCAKLMCGILLLLFIIFTRNRKRNETNRRAHTQSDAEEIPPVASLFRWFNVLTRYLVRLTHFICIPYEWWQYAARQCEMQHPKAVSHDPFRLCSFAVYARRNSTHIFCYNFIVVFQVHQLRVGSGFFDRIAILDPNN